MKLNSPYIIELADTLDHHYYHVWIKNKTGGKGKHLGVFPSATTILNAYPQSQQLTQWIADQGWSEAQEIKSKAGRDGTTIHQSIETLLDGGELNREGYKIEVWYKLDAFARWYAEYKPKIIAKEIPVFSKRCQVPGRLDLLAEIDGKIGIIDYKSSASLHKHFPLQFSVYADAVEEFADFDVDFTAALHLGARNKDKYNFKQWFDWREEHLPIFQAVHKTWVYDRKKEKDKGVEPPILVLPDKIKLKK